MENMLFFINLSFVPMLYLMSKSIYVYMLVRNGKLNIVKRVYSWNSPLIVDRNALLLCVYVLLMADCKEHEVK